MKILYDDNMPFAAEFFGDFGDSQPFSHLTLQPDALRDCDALLVRSTTRVDQSLLAQANQLKFVATATAGTNHLDLAYLNARGIAAGSAAGCNAVAVAEYVLASIFVCAQRLGWTLPDKRVGIVGAGHVGSAVAERLQILGFDVRLCDPPLAAQTPQSDLVNMEEIMACDIICLHCSLTRDTEHPSYHLFDHERLNAMSGNQLLVNACRGEVIDNRAALRLLEQGKPLNLVFDVWENEPDILQALVPHTLLATQHIAGHTLEGKARGTEMLYQQLCERMALPVSKQLQDMLPAPMPAQVSVDDNLDWQGAITSAITQVYDINADDAAFRAHISEAGWFAYSRKHYAIRREFATMTVNAGNSAATEALYRLGFKPK